MPDNTMDQRATASPTGEEDYVTYFLGENSWSVPYLAGVYALALQVDNDITPKEFFLLADQTKSLTTYDYQDSTHDISILNPVGIIESLEKNKE